MSTNPPNLRPDLAPKLQVREPVRTGQPTIGMVSLGCPKALVDSERILTPTVNVFWREHPAWLYNAKDIYGNKDLSQFDAAVAVTTTTQNDEQV